MLRRTSLYEIIVCVFIALLVGPLKSEAQGGRDFPPLEFSEGERILFLGGSFFENELEEGYLEFAIASRWPDRQLIFRNLGWTGDNVFGQARSTFTSPPTPYEQLFQQIRSTRPDYIFIAYGTVEAQQGAAGLNEFTRGLEAIIDSAEVLGAKTILLSTLPVKLAGTAENTLIQNKNLKMYADAISSIASKRGKRFIDLYTPVSRHEGAIYAYNGIHLNKNGYYFLAQVLENALGWPDRGETIAIDAAENNKTAADGSIEFSIEEQLLPLPAPGQADPSVSVSIKISGLNSGQYTLFENGEELLSAPAADWAKGITLDKGISQAQAVSISDSLARKNHLFFRQYRPMNRTYILGFREYEQGRHKKGLQELDGFIARLEEYVGQHLKPVKKTYTLRPAK